MLGCLWKYRRAISYSFMAHSATEVPPIGVEKHDWYTPFTSSMERTGVPGVDKTGCSGLRTTPFRRSLNLRRLEHKPRSGKGSGLCIRHVGASVEQNIDKKLSVHLVAPPPSAPPRSAVSRDRQQRPARSFPVPFVLLLVIDTVIIRTSQSGL
mmetsp:Transcript_2731/g.8285  ORF Transcript_2731/g.8285 Transcript_2731/m.8285 type:complete len:153 (+) Transcript_2731:545-1003(+)